MMDIDSSSPSRYSMEPSDASYRRLAQSNQYYAICMLSETGHVISWNRGAERIQGYKANEIIGKHCAVFHVPDALQRNLPDYELSKAVTDGRYEAEGWRLRKDGSSFWANVVITAMLDNAGCLAGFAKLTRDMSVKRHNRDMAAEVRNREEMLEAERSARIAAQRAARVKDEFLATLSHELRSPLNAILGWTQILKNSTIATNPGEIERARDVIERNARAQVQLIEDLLDSSRIIAGRIHLDVLPLAFDELVRGAIESSQPTALAKGVQLNSRLNAVVGRVAGDPVRLQQVVWNLLSNAIKFTPKGGRIDVRLDQSNHQLRLTVSDTGVGMPASFLPQVFDRFAQNDSSASRAHGGLGLGLAIVKQLVELHGGTIEAHSAGEGLGATFVVTLPIDAAMQGGADVEAEDVETTAGRPSGLPDLKGAHVLVVDDEADSRDIVRRALEAHGARVTIATSGAEVLSLLDVSKPDVLVSDVGMPGMDGYQLIRRIRASERLGAKLPAIALTAFARVEDRKRATLAGFQTHLSKPFDMRQLVILVAGLLDRSATFESQRDALLA